MKWENLTIAEEGERLALKGFLFQADDGRWILANEPDLKSCCVGAVDKQKTQITLLGDFSHYSTHVPLQVSGIFHLTSCGRYSLSDIEAAQKEGFPIWTIGGVVLICLVGIKLKRLLLP